MSREPKASEPKLPSAAELADVIARNFGLFDSERRDTGRRLAEFQRDTLLAAAESCRVLEKECVKRCICHKVDAIELERLAAEAGK